MAPFTSCRLLWLATLLGVLCEAEERQHVELQTGGHFLRDNRKATRVVVDERPQRQSADKDSVDDHSALVQQSGTIEKEDAKAKEKDTHKKEGEDQKRRDKDELQKQTKASTANQEEQKKQEATNEVNQVKSHLSLAGLHELAQNFEKSFDGQHRQQNAAAKTQLLQEAAPIAGRSGSTMEATPTRWGSIGKLLGAATPGAASGWGSFSDASDVEPNELAIGDASDWRLGNAGRMRTARGFETAPSMGVDFPQEAGSDSGAESSDTDLSSSGRLPGLLTGRTRDSSVLQVAPSLITDADDFAQRRVVLPIEERRDSLEDSPQSWHRHLMMEQRHESSESSQRSHRPAFMETAAM